MSAVPTQRQISVRATPREIVLHDDVAKRIDAALKATTPPLAAFYIDLMHRDALALAVKFLIPSGLSAIIPHSTERLLPFRLSSYFSARPAGRESVAVDEGTLRAQNTEAARKCLACIPNALDWLTASDDERRLILASTFLRTRSQRAAS